MNQKLFNVLVFAAGAAVGSLVTWKIMKDKCEHEIQQEVDAFKEEYARCMSESSSDETPVYDEEDWDDEWGEDDGDWDESDVIDYHKLANKYNTGGIVAENGGEGGGDIGVPYINGPYVITPEEYSVGFNPCVVTYYADGVLADPWDVEMDIEETIGEDALEHFGDHAEDVVHVRNERLEVDYEVVKDPRNYADVRLLMSPNRIYEG